jgi:4-hydroxybenzoate polyprenyltransferase
MNTLELESVPRWKLYFGLSRTAHGILDAATPAMAALLWLGYFPPVTIVVAGLITAFAGYTAVYALNDLLDHRVDRDRLAFRDGSEKVFHVDEIMVQHPVAQGMLSFKKGLIWCAAWAVVALIGALWLNPVCAVLFAVSATLEAMYCKLLRITHLKIIPSVAVKSIGGLAGVLAVDPSPSPGFLALLVIWLAAWEVGGQNIANDIVDMQEDSRVSARTTITAKGLPEAVFRVIVASSIAFVSGVAIYWAAGEGIGWLYPPVAAALGWTLLLEPSRRLYYQPGRPAAASLFNRASYIPVSFLVLVVASMYVPS